MFPHSFRLGSGPIGHFIDAPKTAAVVATRLQDLPTRTKLIPTIPINVFITLISKLVHVRVFLVIVFDATAVVASIAKVVLIDVPLVHIGHQHAVVLLYIYFGLKRYTSQGNVRVWQCVLHKPAC